MEVGSYSADGLPGPVRLDASAMERLMLLKGINVPVTIAEEDHFATVIGKGRIFSCIVRNRAGVVVIDFTFDVAGNIIATILPRDPALVEVLLGSVEPKEPDRVTPRNLNDCEIANLKGLERGKTYVFKGRRYLVYVSDSIVGDMHLRACTITAEGNLFTIHFGCDLNTGKLTLDRNIDCQFICDFLSGCEELF